MNAGIDIIEIERFKKMAKSQEELRRIFTENEILYFQTFSNPLEHIAGTFAAKEAVCKAFKTGFSLGIAPLCIEVLHRENIPYINLHGKAKEFFEERGFKNIDVSISHDKSSAIAICIIN